MESKTGLVIVVVVLVLVLAALGGVVVNNSINARFDRLNTSIVNYEKQAKAMESIETHMGNLETDLHKLMVRWGVGSAPGSVGATPEGK